MKRVFYDDMANRDSGCIYGNSKEGRGGIYVKRIKCRRSLNCGNNDALSWIAERLRMGASGHLAWLLPLVGYTISHL